MKKLSFSLLLILLVSSALVFTSCNNDDDTNTNNNTTRAPTLTEAGNTTRVRDNGGGIGTRTLTKDRVWILENFVFVSPGQTLTIEPGTVIKGAPGTGERATALIVARGGKIMAEGTAAAPIIFTAEEDDIANTTQAVDQASGRWGGVIVLGAAGTNTTPAEQAIEGIPTTESRGLYGGTNDADNSGVLKYVSIRHGGTDIGAGNEINSLTLGGVGSGTVIENIEVIYNADDGIEFFGGTVNVKRINIAFCEDDGIDYDQGYRGKIQFALVLQGSKSGQGDRGAECDGGTSPEDGNPYATPTLSNLTFIGGGKDSTSRRVATLRDNAGGYFHNSVFVEFGRGIDIEDLASGEDSKARLDAGQLAFKNNQFWNIRANNDSLMIYILQYPQGSGSGSTSKDISIFANNGNLARNPGIVAGYSPTGQLNVVPSGDVSGAQSVGDAWFETTNYRGAFAPGGANWLAGWTKLSTHGYLAQ